jgi:H+/Cl- antiporter ClcA
MRKKVVEGSVLFISILKWLFLATCIGVIVGISTAVFLKLLNISISSAARFQYYFLLLPAALFLSAFIVKTFAPDAEGPARKRSLKRCIGTPAG